MAILDLQRSNARFTKEASIRCEDVHKDDKELTISKIFYNRIKEEIYKSMDKKSRSKYIRIKNNIYNNQNVELTINKETKKINNYIGFEYTTTAFAFEKMYYLNVLLYINEGKKQNIEEFAAYDTQTNTLFLPLLNKNLSLNSELLIDFENNAWTITHEISYKLDFDNMIFSEEDFVKAGESVYNATTYYNNEVEFSAYSKELIHFMIDCFLSGFVDYKEIIENFSNPKYVEDVLDDMFKNKNTVAYKISKLTNITTYPYFIFFPSNNNFENIG